VGFGGVGCLEVVQERCKSSDWELGKMLAGER